MKLQKLGGYASIVLVLVGMASIAMLTIAFRGFTGSGDSLDPAKMKAAYEASPIAFHSYYVLGILGGILVLIIALAIQERMQAKASNLMRFAVIAASACSALSLTTMISGFLRYKLLAETGDLSAYRSALVLYTCLGTAAENAWGWALLLIGLAGLSTLVWPRVLSWLILVSGIVSIIGFAMPTIPGAAGMVIDGIVVLLEMVSMIWLGVVLIRKPESIAAQL